MRNRNIVQFEQDSTGIWNPSKEKVIQNLRELYKAIRDVNKPSSGTGVKFDLNFLFADVLECIDLLNFADLTQVIGVVNCNKVWDDVSKTRKQ